MLSGKKLVVLSAAVAALGFFLLFRKPALPAVGTGVTVTNEPGGIIFTRPNGVTKAPLLIVYGGLTKFSWARKQAMAEAVPEAVKLRTFGVFLDHNEMGLVEAISAAKNLASKYGLTFTSVKAMGFSAGAIKVQQGVDTEAVFLGLIDPSTRAEFINASFGARGRMLYNAANWGAYPNIKAALPKVSESIVSKGGVARELPLSHSAFPKVFFDTFQSELIAP